MSPRPGPPDGLCDPLSGPKAFVRVSDVWGLYRGDFRETRCSTSSQRSAAPVLEGRGSLLPFFPSLGPGVERREVPRGLRGPSGEPSKARHASSETRWLGASDAPCANAHCRRAPLDLPAGRLMSCTPSTASTGRAMGLYSDLGLTSIGADRLVRRGRPDTIGSHAVSASCSMY